MSEAKAMTVTASVACGIINLDQTQHRVPIHPQPDEDGVCLYLPTGKYTDTSEREYNPRYRKEDILWLREPGRIKEWEVRNGKTFVKVTYPSDGGFSDWIELPERIATSKSKYQMPAWVRGRHGCPNGIFKEAARSFLKVANLKAERLQEISNAEALFEGVKDCSEGYYTIGNPMRETPREAFFDLWDKLYSKNPEYQVKSNPWVWAWTFKPCEKPTEE